ncbi:YccF family protein [Rhizobium sp. PL01]|uniref:YccF family protein n=1 Tax=Rhizobium sp. PL01 TaxID=3085631 RepID=UPI0029814855|nr:YccF family protein [Rhizobium sp. PL01]MDW5316426.1 YccF family protein [Rhizobium sp. PL01]
MRFAGNVIWFVFGGAVLALTWLFGALLFAISIIGLPVARAAVEMAKLSAFPFGKDVVHVREIDGKGVSATTAATGTIGFVANIIWMLTFGWVLFLGYLVAGVINCLTIIGIPFGLQSFKLAGLSFWPVGRRVVTKEMANAVRKQNAAEKLDRLRGKKTNLPEAA